MSEAETLFGLAFRGLGWTRLSEGLLRVISLAPSLSARSFKSASRSLLGPGNQD